MAANRNLWHDLITFENLYCAFRKAAKSKRGSAEVAHFELNLEENIFNLIDELSSGKYFIGEYKHFFIHEPKHRLISAAPFRDRVVHHALCNIIEPIFEKKFIYDGYANRKGKGNHRALDRCTQFMRKYQHVLPLDIRQFFPEIDHQILIKEIAKTITDKNIIDLCRKIIASGGKIKSGINAQETEIENENLFLQRPKSLPIGNLTSQFWANVYLNPLDHFIKRDLKCKGYIRYVDDILLFSNEKVMLHQWKQSVAQFINKLRLSIHEGSAQPRPCNIGLPFLGFQVFPDHRRLKRRKAVQARRRIKSFAKLYRNGEMSFDDINSRILSWINHASFGDTWGLRKSIFTNVIF